MTPEGLVKHEVCNFLERIGLFFWINKSTGVYDTKRRCFRRDKSRHNRLGVSDILGILPDGRFLAIELKSKKGRLSEEQELFIADANAMGAVAFMARSSEDVRDGLIKAGIKLGQT